MHAENYSTNIIHNSKSNNNNSLLHSQKGLQFAYIWRVRSRLPRDLGAGFLYRNA